MPILRVLPRAEHAEEMMDGPLSDRDLSRCLADIARTNAVSGGRRLTVDHVEKLLAGIPPHRRIVVLDVGTGGGDLPRALVRWARRAGRQLCVIALDRDLLTLRIARRNVAGYPEIRLLQGDALALPLRPGAVDVVVSVLTLHHLEPPEAARALAEMDAAARVGLIVHDLSRSRTAYALVWLATRALARTRIARHDGPLSVLRAYTPDEAERLCEKAGLSGARVLRYPFLARQCVVMAKT